MEGRKKVVLALALLCFNMVFLGSILTSVFMPSPKAAEERGGRQVVVWHNQRPIAARALVHVRGFGVSADLLISETVAREIKQRYPDAVVRPFSSAVLVESPVDLHPAEVAAVNTTMIYAVEVAKGE